MTERMMMAKTDTTTLLKSILAYTSALDKGGVRVYQLQALRAETTGLTMFAERVEGWGYEE